MDSIDHSYIWQRRIAHSIRLQKGAVPFPESVRVGLEFNAALERTDKLDQNLLTNAVMLEICDFAKTVTKSEKYFLFEMLEFNFDLGVDVSDDKQLYSFASRVHNKIKLLREQIRFKPGRWKELFPLPHPNLFSESEPSGLYCPKWNKTADSSVLTDGTKNSLTAENRAESPGGASSPYVIKKRGGVRLKRAEEAYPFCTQLGVSLAVGLNRTPGQKLDPDVVTSGVMMELLDFSRVLCGSHSCIVHELVWQNFGVELDKLLFRPQVNRLLERKYGCLTAADRDAFKKEPFQFQSRKRREPKDRKRKTREEDLQELERQTRVCQRRETLRSGDASEKWRDGHLSYMCPVDFENDVQGAEAEPSNTELDVCLSGVEDVKQDEEDASVSGPTGRRRSEDVEKQKLWTRRAGRTKLILTSTKVNDLFARCREIGLDFNVASGTRQNLDLQLFTNWVLTEVYRFANAMTKSFRSFLFDILQKNFNLALQDELHERNFIFYIVTKVKSLQNHPDRHGTEFLSRPFHFPRVYNTVDVTSSIQWEQEVKTESYDSSESAPSQRAGAEPHPFCKQLGLNLWSTEERPVTQKLDVSVLTSGAMLETFNFVRDLCGTVRDTVNDILEHNFDLDLRRGETDAAKVIQRWYSTQKSLKKQNMSGKINRWLNMLIPVNGLTHLSPEPAGLQDLDPGHSESCRKLPAYNYQTCREIGLDLDISSRSEAKVKLDLQVLTRAVLFEMHQYVEQNCNRYVPALYEILEYNFDLRSQSHRKVEFAWSFAAQVLAIAGKAGRTQDYQNQVFQLPFEGTESPPVACKDEPEDNFGEPDLDDDVMFVRKLKPVDIEVEID
ncbi:uncharacterized protein [Embiotoca jacksoni]|uniref:uncharacterized protein n=1 Tax=Embiotoca jacksoni TaxID=100190 RepID=UPI0037046A59